MAFILADRVKETTTTTGTGSLTLAGAVAGFQTFTSKCVTDTDDFFYCIEGVGTSEWEMGLGRLTGASTLQRTQVSSSSNSDALVSFSAGTKVVFITLPGQEASGFGMSLFGNGSDGDLVVSSGTTTLGTRDRHYRNVTVNGTGSIQPANYRLFVSAVLNLSDAPAGAIAGLPIAGGNGSAAGGAGAASSNTASGQFGPGGAGTAGGAGGVNAGSNSTAAGGQSVSLGGLRAGAGANNGTAGSGASAGGVGVTQSTGSQAGLVQSPRLDLIQGITLMAGGQGGNGGGGGGGNGAISGGGGGGGGSGGAIVWVSARYLLTNAGTAATAIRSYGGNGGNGGSPVSGTNNGGGGGGMGGGGGYVNLIVGDRLGAAVTGLVAVDSGTGGNGGNGFGTGGGGNGGGTMNSGTALFICLCGGIVLTLATVSGNVAGTAASGGTGGGGRAATQGRLTC